MRGAASTGSVRIIRILNVIVLNENINAPFEENNLESDGHICSTNKGNIVILNDEPAVGSRPYGLNIHFTANTRMKVIPETVDRIIGHSWIEYRTIIAKIIGIVIAGSIVKIQKAVAAYSDVIVVSAIEVEVETDGLERVVIVTETKGGACSRYVDKIVYRTAKSITVDEGVQGGIGRILFIQHRQAVVKISGCITIFILQSRANCMGL